MKAARIFWVFALVFIASSIYAIANSAPVLNSVVGGGKEPEPLSNNLAAYWDFDDWNETHVFDGTSNNNDGLIAGANRSYGKLGWGMVFDGVDNIINVSDANSLDITNDLTIEAWIKINSIGEEAFKIILTKQDQSDFFVPYQIIINSRAAVGGSKSSPVAILVLGNGSTGAPAATSNQITNMAGEWTYVAATVSGSIIQMYVNGKPSGTAATFNGTRQTNANSVILGCYPGELPCSGYFNGTMDEVQIWNKALSAD